jgi:short-chain fatty acids transporter
MSFVQKFAKIYKALLPSPFAIAIVLSLFVFVLALIWGRFPDDTFRPLSVLTYWENGLWNNSLLVFTVQMMLMLVLGHVIALSKPVHFFIQKATKNLDTTAKAAAAVSFLTMCVGLFNWGLGLIFGAIMARKVGEVALERKWNMNYPLVGAAGYSGMLIWHGGLSGSSLIKIAEPGHLASMSTVANLPPSISFDETVFSETNLWVASALLIFIPFFLFQLGLRLDNTPFSISSPDPSITENETPSGADRIDQSPYWGTSIGLIILLYATYKMFGETGFFSFFTPNNINLVLLGLALLFHSRFNSFLAGLDIAIVGVAGILIQFPLYFGILGVLKDAHLLQQFTEFVSAFATASNFPFITFSSAALVNILVPSGGGQWAIQGPFIIETATKIGAPLAQNILAFAYGDQITNMLQPFWALPLLGITGLKAKEILPYTLLLFLVALPIFILGLWLV